MSKRVDMNDDTAIIEYANGEVSHHNPKFKMEHFVGGSMLTPFKRMHQYLVELRTKQDSFLHCEWELKKKEIELLIEEKKYKRAKDSNVDELEEFQKEPKGELTVLISEKKTDENDSQNLSESDINIINKMINKLTIKEITDLICQNSKVSKKLVYRYCLKLKNEN